MLVTLALVSISVHTTQIWASSFLPNEARAKDRNQLAYFEKHGRPLLMDYMEREVEKQERVVCSNQEWVVVVPYWAVWPYESMVLPRKHVTRFTDLDAPQRVALAEIIGMITTRYDNLFQCSFPYSMGWHGE